MDVITTAIIAELAGLRSGGDKPNETLIIVPCLLLYTQRQL